MHLRNESRRRTRKTGAEEIIEMMMGEKLHLTAVNVGIAGMTMRYHHSHVQQFSTQFEGILAIKENTDISMKFKINRVLGDQQP